MSISLPVADPIGEFFILVLLLLLSPMAADCLRIPGIIGIVVAGALVGPNGLGVLGTDGMMKTLGDLGLLYVFLSAGLEIDVRRRGRKKDGAVALGALTSILPLALGYAVGRFFFRMDILSALLLGSLFAFHTLLPYPITQTMGLSGGRAVFAAMGATALADGLAMAVLALATAGKSAGADWIGWLRMIGVLVLWTAAAVTLLPPLVSRFFRRVKAGGTTEFLFALVVASFCAAAAALSGLEPALGMFVAGLILNRHIPERGGLKAQLKFVGNSLFIPICVLYIGMLSDIPAALTDARSVLLILTMLSAVLVSKYGASLLLKPLLGFSLAEVNLSFGLTVDLAAPALAVALIGYRGGFFGNDVLSGTVLALVVTCALGPVVTRRAAAHLAVEDSRETEADEDFRERILIAVSNPATLRPLAELAFRMRNPRSEEPVLPVCIVQDSLNSDRDLEQAETVLAQAIAQGVSQGVPVRPSTLVSLNAAEGILHASEERDATAVLLGWNRPPKSSGIAFGDVIDQVIAGGRALTIVARLRTPLEKIPAFVLVVPPFAERNPGARRAYALIRRILEAVSAKLTVVTLASDAAGIRGSLRRIRGSAPRVTELETWKEFPKALEKLPAETAFVFLCPRPGRLAWHPSLEQLPREASESFPDSTILLFYFPDEVLAQTAAASDVETASFGTIAEKTPERPEDRTGGGPPDPADRFYRELLDADRVVPNLDSAAVVDVIRELLERGFPGDKKTINRLTGVYSEIAQKQPIELAPGVLLLHAHVDNIARPLVLIGAKPSGLRLLALDEPVRIVVMMCAPSSQSPEDHLRALSLIAKALKDTNRIDRILRAETAEELKEE